jgi:hypothetical protein
MVQGKEEDVMGPRRTCQEESVRGCRVSDVPHGITPGAREAPWKILSPTPPGRRNQVDT